MCREMLTECWRHPYEYIYKYQYVLVATPGTTPLRGPWTKFDSH